LADGNFVLQCDRCRLGLGTTGNGHTAADVLAKVRLAEERHDGCNPTGALQWSNRGPMGLAEDPSGRPLPPVLGVPSLAPGNAPVDVLPGVQPMAALLPEFLWLECPGCSDLELIA
jgi:hypothetical protein